MQINRLHLKNFRSVKNDTFNLHPRFNVIIGHNGTGKSTLLHAMQVATGAFFLGLPRVNRRHIQENEIWFTINLKSKQSEYFTPTIVEATGHINGSGEFTWRRVIPEYGRATSAKAEDVGQIELFKLNALTSSPRATDLRWKYRFEVFRLSRIWRSSWDN